jgi:hypothetical protein
VRATKVTRGGDNELHASGPGGSASKESKETKGILAAWPFSVIVDVQSAGRYRRGGERQWQI